jgi:hypothetical protein
MLIGIPSSLPASPLLENTVELYILDVQNTMFCGIIPIEALV